MVFVDHDTGEILAAERDASEECEVISQDGFMYEAPTDAVMTAKAVAYLQQILSSRVHDHTRSHHEWTDLHLFDL
jgi:hypothetical protein